MRWGVGEAVMRSHSFKEQQQGCVLSLQLPPERQEEPQPACWSTGSRADFQPPEAADPEAEAPGGLALRSPGHCAFLSWGFLSFLGNRRRQSPACSKFIRRRQVAWNEMVTYFISHNLF